MFAFFSKYGLNGKTIILFTTTQAMELEVLSAQSIYGHDVPTNGKKSVEAWVKKLGM